MKRTLLSVLCRAKYMVREYKSVLKKAGSVFGACVLTLLCVLGFPGQRFAGDSNGDSFPQEEEKPAESIIQEQLCVYVCGQVCSPGVYYLNRGSRVCDAIEMAQGFTSDAAVENLNLAREVKDGEQIVVRSQEELDESGSQNNSSTTLVNINGATAEQLQQIPGIGPSLAQKIISYRNAHGSFGDIEELKEVSGIGDKKLDSFREYICV